VRRGNTYSAPLKLVMHYILVVGVKTDATSLMYSNISDMKNRVKDNGLEMVDAVSGSEAMIIASEILAQQRNRMLDYQSKSDNFKMVANSRKTK
jgi:hypothetical protein